MEINILVFGQIAEMTGESSFAFSDVEDTDELILQLKDDYPQLQSLEFSIAVNKKIIRKNTALKNNDTVAILPPFSGG